MARMEKERGHGPAGAVGLRFRERGFLFTRARRLIPRISRRTRMGKGFQSQPLEQIDPVPHRSKSLFIRAIRVVRGSLLRLSGFICEIREIRGSPPAVIPNEKRRGQSPGVRVRKSEARRARPVIIRSPLRLRPPSGDDPPTGVGGSRGRPSLPGSGRRWPGRAG